MKVRIRDESKTELEEWEICIPCTPTNPTKPDVECVCFEHEEPTHERNVLMWYVRALLDWRRNIWWFVPIAWILGAALVLSSCASPTSASASTENEMYIEARTWYERDDLRTKVGSVNFTNDQVADYSGWIKGDDIWYWTRWVNEPKRTKRDLNELARHEVCHASKGTNHMELWCDCMHGYQTIYCEVS